MKDFFETIKISTVGLIVAPILTMVIISLLPVVAIDYIIRKKKKRFL